MAPDDGAAPPPQGTLIIMSEREGSPAASSSADGGPGGPGGSGGTTEGPNSGLSIGRLVSFTDAVVAIALTLLVLPLAELVPEAAQQHESAVDIVTGNLDAIGAFLISFAVIGRYWIGHHRMFDQARTVSRALVLWNLLWLLTIVVLPFPTQMVSTLDGDPAVPRFYIGTLLATSACTAVMTVLVRRSLDPSAGLGDGQIRGSVTATLLQLVAFLIVLVAPQLTYWPLLLLFGQDVVERLVRHRRSG
jgi:uncharacterized membrane protein